MQEEPTLDQRALARLREMDPGGVADFLSMLIDQFLREASSGVGTIQEAIKRRDPAATKAAAHRLKGSSLTMGANRLASLCGRIEAHLDWRADDAAGPLMAALDVELARVGEAFAAERRTP